MFEEGDSVRLKRSIGDIVIGSSGIILAKYSTDIDRYEVEFYNKNSLASKLLTVSSQEISSKDIVEILFDRNSLISFGLLSKNINPHYSSIEVKIEVYIYPDSYQQFITHISIDDANQFIKDLEALILRKTNRAKFTSLSPQELDFHIVYENNSNYFSLLVSQLSFDYDRTFISLTLKSKLETSLSDLLSGFKKLFLI